MTVTRFSLAALLSTALFVLLALAFIPYPGIQNDEAFFTYPLFVADRTVNWVQIGHHLIPLMVISYTGALKTWIYALIFRVGAPSVWTLRVPVVLAGAATVWLTWIYVRRIAGARAAAIAALLLATDTSFLITNTFDWGPVALQHLLLLGGLTALTRAVQTDSRVMFALSGFCWGLGLWDKALLIWPLMGLCAAAMLVYPGDVLRRARFRPVALFTVALIIGAAPLIWFNIANTGVTASGNSHFGAGDFDHKLLILKRTVDSSVYVSYMVRDDQEAKRRAPDTPLERASVWLARITGSPRTNWMIPALGGALVIGLALGDGARRRLILFTTLTMVVTWLAMAFTLNAGGAAHHVVLLWPFPFVLIGLALDAVAIRWRSAWGRRIAIACTLTLAADNVLASNALMARFVTNGETANWTDAVLALSDAVPPGAKEIEAVDWGYANTLLLLHNGKVGVRMAGDWLGDPHMEQWEIDRLRAMIASPDYVFIQHTDGNQIFPGVNAKLRAIAEASGYREKVTRVIPDSNGRPMFELLRFEKAG